MGERKGVNKYYPPDFDPAKHGSLNKYRNSHPLRERARKLSQGILIIRFEMPYNIWCDGCGKHIGMGVRYNAEKKKVGNYYTTPIYRFRMKCHLCVNHIEMQTDPANCDYVIVSGARRKEERWDMKDNEQILTTEHEEKKLLETDAMYKLEHGVSDQEKLKIAIPTLSDIQEMQNAWKDDFAMNSMLRKKFRDEKKVLKEVEEKDEALRNKASLSIPLVQESEDDKHLASLLKFHTMDSYEDKQRLKRKEITSRSWFASSQVAMGEKAGETLKKLGLNKILTTKSTNSPNGFAASNLGIIRRKSESQKQQSLLISRKKDSGSKMRNRTDQKDHVPDSTTGDCVSDLKEEADISLQTEAVIDSDRDLNTSSLVADYSDSSSDTDVV
ncbi:coiled-coil domain-containing protein 130 homolog [Chiloscyllium plagiosum]|uniref:coiled-coil domain-containing protein 130 homolog n=1 Tax=Chiloscyllium plagiosum TaxID=36176 RepID=UPI001CB857AB|nr:coiled-coil domain-containing protein 130 homolog [Chiloscyllium plagiosum]XP_043550989.1 coiled-coil domain-containing protein 130 homolog [Chiloscyllium plagiosum]XP_043550990.1 coiled-coil domain-containing protein 130 homolog [Chiloscyllium plagiosum]XP_043550991.1 coiled-coil domain-containing protein 130 homolog [Chiloscyllium plagiosum]